MENFEIIDKLCSSLFFDIVVEFKDMDEVVNWATSYINIEEFDKLRMELKSIESYTNEQLVELWNNSKSGSFVVEGDPIREFFSAVKKYIGS